MLPTASRHTPSVPPFIFQFFFSVIYPQIFTSHILWNLYHIISFRFIANHNIHIPNHKIHNTVTKWSSLGTTESNFLPPPHHRARRSRPAPRGGLRVRASTCAQSWQEAANQPPHAVEPPEVSCIPGRRAPLVALWLRPATGSHSLLARACPRDEQDVWVRREERKDKRDVRKIRGKR
jgi:hypothetical protein